MTNHPDTRQKPGLFLLLLVLLILAGGFFVLRGRTQNPIVFAQAGASLTEVMWREGNWYWLEAAGKPGSRLIRANASGSLPPIAAPGINAYAVADGMAVWSAHDGNHWTITLAAADGSGKNTLWAGEQELSGLCIAEGRVFWMVSIPPTLPESGPLPPLTNKLQIVSVPTAGGSPEVIATLLETTGKQVIGVHDGQLYVSAVRHTSPEVTTIYRVALNGGSAHRVAGETGVQPALLTKEGALYWSAPSRESTQRDKVVCIRRLGKEDKPETLTDWLPGGGHLYESGRGVCYVDGDPLPAAWAVSAGLELPRSIPLPQDFSVLSVGNGELLLKSSASPSANFPIYRMGLP